MAKKTIKKVDPKKVAKVEVCKTLSDALALAGIQFSSGLEFGMTEGTLVAHLGACDVQIKLITPKAGVDRYEKAEEEEAGAK